MNDTKPISYWMRERRANAARDRPWRRDFGFFWAAQGASLTGEQIREFTIPLIAIFVLHASATELGILGALQWLPFLLLALPLGVVVDRHRRRGLLVISETGRGLLTLALVAVVVAGALSLPVLLAAVTALGTFAVLYEVAYQSAVPSLVPRSRLAGANARIQATSAAAEIGGPGLGGLLLQLLGATATLAVNAGTYLLSAGALLAMRSPEPGPAGRDRHFLAELRAGANHVLRDPYLRANVGFSALYNPFGQWMTLLLTLYAVQGLHLQPGQIGLVFSLGAVGAFVGAASASRLAARLRVGRTMVACVTIECAALLVVPAVDPSWSSVAIIPVLGTAMACNGVGVAASSVLLITVRQLRTPDELLGRVNATMRTVTYGTIPLGALGGGFVGEWLGARTGLLIGAVLCLGTVVWVVLSPLSRIRRLEDLEVSMPSAARVGAR